MKISVNHLNQALRRELGEAGGRQKYKWVRSDELTFPVEDGQETVQAPNGGLFLVQTRYKQMPILHGEPRWALAILIEPEVAETTWGQIYGAKLPHPSNGYYFPTDVVCRPGADPDQELTSFLIAAAKACRESNPFEIRNTLDAAMARAERDREERLEAELSNLMDRPDPPAGRVVTYGDIGR